MPQCGKRTDIVHANILPITQQVLPLAVKCKTTPTAFFGATCSVGFFFVFFCDAAAMDGHGLGARWNRAIFEG